MSILEKKESEIDWNKSCSEQIDKLLQFDNLSDPEILYIANNGHKSSSVGILVEYLGYERLHKFLPNFLTFLQEMNWPASRGTANMLLNSNDKILIEIQRVIKEVDDTIWHYWILVQIVKHWKKETIERIKQELLYLIENERQPQLEGVSIESLLILRENNLISKAEGLEKYLLIEKKYANNLDTDWSENLLLLKYACS